MFPSEGLNTEKFTPLQPIAMPLCRKGQGNFKGLVYEYVCTRQCLTLANQ